MKRTVAIFLAILMALSLFACGTNTPSGTSPSDSETSQQPSSDAQPSASSSEPETGEQQYGGILKVVNSAEGSAPLGIPWAQATLEQLLLAPFFEELVKIKTNGEVVPWLAESWELDESNNSSLSKSARTSSSPTAPR